MVKNKKLLAGYKVFFGLLGLSAIITEITVLMHRGTFVPANFFSYFTIQSNLLAVVALLGGALLLMRGKERLAFTLFRGAVTLYMTVTGIIFALLLSGYEAGTLTAVPWDNTVLHYIMPIAVFADWLLDRPSRRIAFRAVLIWLLYPVAYLAYTLIRGHIVGWYPYPFINAAEKGYVTVVITNAAIAAVGLALSWAIARIIKKR